MKAVPTLVLWAALLGACATDKPPLQQEFQRVETLCREQWEKDRRAGKRDWFSRWVNCRTEHAMPLEIRAIPTKEEAIRDVYAKIVPLSLQVDNGTLPLREFHFTWNRLRAQARLPYCMSTLDDGSGTARCMGN